MSRLEEIWIGHEISRQRQRDAWSPLLTEAERKRLAGCDDEAVRCAVATSPHTPKKLLRELYREFPFQVALNPATPPATMDGWVTAAEAWRREAIARNPKATEQQLFRLAEDQELSVRAQVACRRDLPAPLIEKLAADEDPSIRCAIARREDAPSHVIEALLNDENRNVKRAAASACGLD